MQTVICCDRPAILPDEYEGGHFSSPDDIVYCGGCDTFYGVIDLNRDDDAGDEHVTLTNKEIAKQLWLSQDVIL